MIAGNHRGCQHIVETGAATRFTLDQASSRFFGQWETLDDHESQATSPRPKLHYAASVYYLDECQHYLEHLHDRLDQVTSWEELVPTEARPARGRKKKP